MASEAEENPEIDLETTCPECYAEFLDPEDLKIHISSVHNKKICHFCSSGYCDDENYAVHLRDAHIMSLKRCQFCSRLFTNAESRSEHEKKHKNHSFTTSNLYYCSQCPLKFSNVFNLEQHELNKHNDVKEGVFLNKYYSLLSSVLNVKAPLFIRSLGTNVTYTCAACKFSTSNAYDYIEHLQQKNCRSMACEKCCTVYQLRKTLCRHFLKHPECRNYVNEADKFAECTSCNKKIEKINLKQHIESCQAFKCSICKTCYPTIQELSKHQSVKHPLAISLTMCTFCHKEFVGTTSLNKHIDRSHRPEFHLYKYACVYCEPRYFKHPKDLFGHFFSTHNDLQPYCCKICNLTFRVRKRFTIHIKMEHNSVGFVEFDKNYHVFFTDQKSEHPFTPTSLIDPDQYPTASKPVKSRKKPLKRTRVSDEKVITDVTIISNPSDTEKSDANNDGNDKKRTVQTDGEKSEQTDIEVGKKPLKKRFKYDASQDTNFVNVNSDFMSATETEAAQTETEAAQTETESKREQPKRKVKTKKRTELDIETADSDDEPLMVVKKKCMYLKKQSKKNIRLIGKKKKNNRKQLTCNVCNKYCYTQQNYQNHMSTHNNEVKKCIKCGREFRNIHSLNKHIRSVHASSKLTETLKTLLERRKQGAKITTLTPRERFLRTIRKVKSVKSTPAKITEASDKLSVQSFIENFTPEQKAESEPTITVKRVNSVARPPTIKIHKFTPKPPPTNVKLAMPVRFKNPGTDKKTKVTIKVVPMQPVIRESYSIPDASYQESFADYDETPDSPERNDTVPEVAEEVVMSTEEPIERPVIQIPHKIIIPKLPEGYKNDIRVAHLQAEAPYFKIVKINELGKDLNQQQQEPLENKTEVTLPKGTKLVTVNPLAHLLGDTPIEKIVGERSKYYKAKRSNFQEAIAKALLNLENKPPRSKKKMKVEVEQ